MAAAGYDLLQTDSEQFETWSPQRLNSIHNQSIFHRALLDLMQRQH